MLPFLRSVDFRRSCLCETGAELRLGHRGELADSPSVAPQSPRRLSSLPCPTSRACWTRFAPGRPGPRSCCRSFTTNCASSPPPGWLTRSPVRPSKPPRSSTKRTCGSSGGQEFDHRGHFFAAAAEAMRRILVENARRKKAEKHGGGLNRHDADEVPIAAPEPVEDLVALDEALDRLAAVDPQKAELVKFRYFAGLTIEEAAQALDISPATAKRYWTYSRAWLFQAISGLQIPD